MRIKWDAADCSNYESRMKQILIYVQNMSTIRQIPVKYEIEIIAIIAYFFTTCKHIVLLRDYIEIFNRCYIKQQEVILRSNISYYTI